MTRIRNFYILLGWLCLLVCGCTPHEPRFVVGVSQCSNDKWREQMNKEIKREALFYPEVQVEIRSANDNNQTQIEDIRSFIAQGVDLLIVSPNESEAITPVVEEAFDKGIPVVLCDRKIQSEKYSAYIGADNYEIGYKAGEYIVGRLQGKGKLVEIMGLKGSSPAVERHKGLVEALKQAPEITLVASADAAWLQQPAFEAVDSILSRFPEIDMIFTQNDFMAKGAYLAAENRGRQQDILFVGIDALAGEGYGIDMVANRQLDATFIYPTGGDRIMQLAMTILKGEKYNRENKLSSALVDKSNVRVMQMQTTHISQLDQKIELLNFQMDKFLMRYSSQRMLLYACIVILLLVGGILFLVVRAFWVKKHLNEELSAQKKQLEEQRDQLLDLSNQLEAATHAKLAFFTNVSHDFRTPLTLIADPVNQLLESHSLGEHERYLLNMAKKNVTVLLRLINQIMDFRKFESGKLQLFLSEFDLAKELKEWTEAFRTLAYKKNISFAVSVEEGKDYTMVADAEKIERMVYNLLSNAFKFTPENGKIEIKATCMERNGEQWLQLCCADTGVGMSVEHVNHIFESFYQIDVHYAGSGIGLALVKAFVEMHHGQIRVESAEGKGTSFILELPMKQAGNCAEGNDRNAIMENLKEGAVLSADQETVQTSSAPDIRPDLKEVVLVIDDNQDIRDYVRMLLQEKYVVVEAANGLEGVQKALKYVPDAIICDVMMPVMDGMECCRRLKAEMQTSHIPIMMLTAYTMNEQKVKGYECGADSYILKPFSAELLLVRLRNLIDNRKRLQTFFTDAASLKKETITGVDKGFVEKLQQLTEDHLSDPELSVESLGEKIGMSRVQLYRKTKALTGHSPNELLRMLRLKKAASLLASTEKTIAEVTYEVGFSSPSYFTKCYKEYFGENPTDFLKRKEGGGEQSKKNVNRGERGC